MATEYSLRPIGYVHSPLRSRAAAPLQGHEGGAAARVEVDAALHAGLANIQVGQDVILLTWLHEARRDVLQVHPRGDRSVPLSGVFATRSPTRPNPIGLHRVRVLAVYPGALEVAPLEAIDGTPIVDIKPVLDSVDDG